MNPAVQKPTVHDFVETLHAALLRPGNAFDAACRRTFGRSPIVARGSFFGDDRLFTEKQAPFALVTVSGDVPVDVELWQQSAVAAWPRGFGIDLVVGFAVTEPVDTPPENCPDSTAPVAYVAGNGSEGESAALAAVGIASQVFSQHGFVAQECVCAYDGVSDWPLETYKYTLTFGTARTLQSGAF